MNTQGSRIPIALQAVFLASNRGEEVHTPPPGKVAFRMFQSIFQKNKKPEQTSKPTPHTTTNISTTTNASSNTTRKGFFGKLKQLRRPTLRLQNIDEHRAQGQQQRPSCDGNAPVDGSKCPVREISFQLTLETDSYSSKSARYITMQDDCYSVASSVTCTVEDTLTKEARKVKKGKKTPQSYFDSMLKRRGYSRKTCYAHETGYYNKPTPLQRSSYHVYIVDLVNNGEADKLRSLFAAGLSTNPANLHGEGLINIVCRLGATDILNVMIDAGCDVQVSDEYGRTPMHNACSTTQPDFSIVEQLLKADPYLLSVMDVRGSLPLSYVKEKDYKKWIYFLQTQEHELWPLRVSKNKPKPPPIVFQQPNTRTVPDPPVMLPCVLIGMLASGRMTPEEVAILNEDDSSDGSETEDEDDDDDEGNEELLLEDFDPDNCSFGQGSTGGYTFDFSESNDKSDASSATLSVSCFNMNEDVQEEHVHEEVDDDNFDTFASDVSPCHVIPSEFTMRSNKQRRSSSPGHPVSTTTMIHNDTAQGVRPFVPHLEKQVITTSTLRQHSVRTDTNENDDIVVQNKEIDLTKGYKNRFSDIVTVPEVYRLSGVDMTKNTIVPTTICLVHERSDLIVSTDKVVSNQNDTAGTQDIVLRQNHSSKLTRTNSVLLHNVNYCIPDNDDGLLFGSC